MSAESKTQAQKLPTLLRGWLDYSRKRRLRPWPSDMHLADASHLALWLRKMQEEMLERTFKPYLYAMDRYLVSLGYPRASRLPEVRALCGPLSRTQDLYVSAEDLKAVRRRKRSKRATRRDAEDVVICSLLYWGARPSEIEKLEWTDVVEVDGGGATLILKGDAPFGDR